MALREVGRNLAAVVTKVGGGSQSFATYSIPKVKPTSPTHAHQHSFSHWINNLKRAENALVAMVGGMVFAALALAAHTANQHLMDSPTVHVNKKKRESMPEVENPDQTLVSADKFINNSFLRNVAHLQENQTRLHDYSARPNPFTRPRITESLKMVGVAPSRY